MLYKLKLLLFLILALGYQANVLSESHDDMFERATSIYNDPKTPFSTISDLFDVFRKLSENGHDCANYYLAGYYTSGNHVSQNFKTSFDYYLKAYNLGCKDSAYLLAHKYENGNGTKVNITRASSLYFEAANFESQLAALHIAKSYKQGTKLLERNLPEAYIWFNKAAQLGSDEAIKELESCQYNGLFCEKHLSQYSNQKLR